MTFLLTEPLKFAGNVLGGAGKMVDNIAGGITGDSPRNQHAHGRGDPAVALLAQQQLALQQQQAANRQEEQNRIKAQEKKQYIADKLNSAKQAVQQGEYSTAVGAFKEVLRLDPNHPEAESGIDEAYKQQGKKFFDQGKYLDAVIAYKQVKDAAGMEMAIGAYLSQIDASLQPQNQNTNSLESPWDILKKYLAANSQLKSAEDAISPYYSELLLAKKREIQGKLNQLRAEDLIQKADQSFAPLQQKFWGVISAAKEEELLPNQRAAEGYLNQLSSVAKDYEEAFKLDHQCSRQNYDVLQRILETVRVKIKQFKIDELVQTLKDLNGGLRLCSLHKEEDLQSIVAHCDQWIAAHRALFQLDNNPRQVEIEQIRTIKMQAETAMSRLKDFTDRGCVEMVKGKIKEDFNQAVSEREMGRLSDQYKQIFSSSYLRNRIISLKPEGFRLFTGIFNEHLKSHIVLTSCFCIPTGYKIDSNKPVTEQVVRGWLDAIPQDKYDLDVQQILSGKLVEVFLSPPGTYYQAEGEEGVS